jgi:2-polyprenyl-6-methoxyphenol hydroxylase-like FAD-dependent oxidoreductase
VLARCFEAAGDNWRDALARYERARLPRANQVHLDSHRRGEALLGVDDTARSQLPSVGQDEVYRYDAMRIPV